MEINIRGALGMQILETLYGVVYLKHIGKELTGININVGGPIADHVKVDYISDLFDFNCPVRIVQGTLKLGAWNFKAFETIMKNMHWLKDFAKFEKVEYHTDSLLHYRSGDRQLVSDKIYARLMNSDDRFTLIGDNIDQMKNFAEWDKIYHYGTVIGDWMHVLHAHNVTCSVTTFVLSTLLFDPNKEVWILSGSYTDGAPHKLADDQYDTIEKLMTIFNNLRWY